MITDSSGKTHCTTNTNDDLEYLFAIIDILKKEDGHVPTSTDVIMVKPGVLKITVNVDGDSKYVFQTEMEVEHVYSYKLLRVDITELFQRCFNVEPFLSDFDEWIKYYNRAVVVARAAALTRLEKFK